MKSNHFLVGTFSLKICYSITDQPPRDGIHSIYRSRSRQRKFHHYEVRKDPAMFFGYFQMSMGSFDYLLKKNSAQVAQKMDKFQFESNYVRYFRVSMKVIIY